MKKKEIVQIKNEPTAYENIITKIAEDLKQDRELVANTMKHVTRWLKIQMSNPSNDKILFNGLGTFSILPGKVKAAIKRGNIQPGNTIVNLVDIDKIDINDNSPNEDEDEDKDEYDEQEDMLFDDFTVDLTKTEEEQNNQIDNLNT